MKIEEHKQIHKKIMKRNYILISVWGLCFILDLIICLFTPDIRPISWFVTGFLLGGIIIMLFEIPMKKRQNDFELFLLDIVQNKYFKLINLIESLKSKKHSIQMKGGKKRKNKNGIK